MNLRDITVYALVVVVIGGPLLWGLISMMFRTKGAWNEEARQIGRYRARHWSYKETVSSVKEFLAPSSRTTHYWPVLANSVGFSGVSGSLKSPQGEIAWKSCIIEQLGEGQQLLFTAHFPLLPDGRELVLPEVLLTELGDGSALSVAQARIHTDEPSAASDMLTEPVLAALSQAQGARAIHIIDCALTFVCAAPKENENPEQILDSLAACAASFLTAVPAAFWE